MNAVVTYSQRDASAKIMQIVVKEPEPGSTMDQLLKMHFCKKIDPETRQVTALIFRGPFGCDYVLNFLKQHMPVKEVQ